MDPDELQRLATPAGLAPLLAAMWHERRGDWTRAHEIAQADDGREGAWVHAYLHRQEGDLENADYWYHRAGRQRSDLPATAEWAEIVGAL